jgi:integrase
LLQAIPRHTVQGQRDYALFLFYLCTGRRSAEVRHLRWGDFSTDSGATWYTWGRRNGHDGHGQRRAECPPQAWDAILAYLGAAGRLATIQPPDYVFTALGNAATHLPNVSARDWRPGERPLSGRAANQLLKRYARQAGLDPQGLSVRTLRYTAALLRVEAGGDLLDVCAFLDHASPAVTARCLRRLVD